MMNKQVYLYFVLLLTAFLSLTSCTNDDVKTSDIPLRTATNVIHISDFSDKLVLLSFGYTHCPDICPATLMHVSQALDLLSKDERTKVQSIFVTVDPERDSPEHLAKYAGFFHGEIIGAAVDKVYLNDFKKAFSIESFKTTQEENYEISHTSYLFLLSEDAKVLDIMGHQTKAESIVQAIRNKLKGSL